MVRGRRPVRGGRQKMDRHESARPKKKKGKFDIREASYIKDRDAKNAEIENRRKRLEEQEAKKRKYESETSDEDEEFTPMELLMSTFSNEKKKEKVAIDSEDESESDEEEIEERNDDSSTIDSENEKEEEEEEQVIEEENLSIEADDVMEDFVVVEEDEEDNETSQEDIGIIRDPFSVHLYYDLSDDLYEAVSNSNPPKTVHRLTWPTLGNVIVEIPKPSGVEKEQPKFILAEKKIFTKVGTQPALIGKDIDWNKLYVKSQIHQNIITANSKNIKLNSNENQSALTPLQRELFSIMNNYQDLLYCERTFSNENEVRFTYCLHVINHILKTRTKILHHNAKLSKLSKSKKGEVPDEYRDQGLVRPKIIILVPFRHSCLKIVNLLIAILIGKDTGGSVMNKKRFMEDFGGAEKIFPKKNPKPEDYEKTFDGNIDDDFKIGISVTKKTLKLYSEFYSSDIIISSPLGLRRVIGADGEKDSDYDFLASIELLIMDQTEIFTMQNWDHLLHVIKKFHLQPNNSHETDFSRVRSWSVNGWSRYYRQTLIFSGIELPEINSIFIRECHNYAGKVNIQNPCTLELCSLGSVVIKLDHKFCRFNASSLKQSFQARMEFFVKEVLPNYKDVIMNHTLIFIPSYFDFSTVRNYFIKEELDFVQIGDYSKKGAISKARDQFFHSGAHFLIYSGRYHFYYRPNIKGIRHLIFFAPPTFPKFYSEMCNMMHEKNQYKKSGSMKDMSVTTIYCKYDMKQMSAIVGTENAARWITSDKNVRLLHTKSF